MTQTAASANHYTRNQERQKRSAHIRAIVFVCLVLLMFGILLYGLFDLQIVNGDTYNASSQNSSVKSIAVKGNRGMITDCNSVVLAKSEKIYNMTFYREDNDWDYPTEQLLEAIEILHSYGNDISVTCPLRRNAETNVWEFNFGDGIAQSSWEKRKSLFYSNNYLSTTKQSTATACFNKLCSRYGISDMGNGTYMLFLDSNGNSIVMTNDTLDLSKVASSKQVDEATVLQVIAINTTMQDNAFLSVPVVIAEDIPFDAVSEIEGRSMSMPWIGVSIGEKRVYPNGSLAATIIGYTGKIQSYERYEELSSLGYSLSDTIGLDGVEASMETWLTANLTERQGERMVETDPNGHITREISYTAPQDGNTVKLTIDSVYQAKAEECIAYNVEQTRKTQEEKMSDSAWLETNKDKIASRDWDTYPIKLATTGVLIVMDVKNGNILAMAQYPGYDLNAMVAGGTEAQQIVLDERGLLMDYAIQTRAEPGSIFKMVTGLAALTNGVLTPTETISDEGRFMNYTTNKNDAPKCWTDHPSYHKDQTIAEGLTNSCNYFFYTLSSRLYESGTERLYKYAAQMGLTSKTGIDLPGELRSVVGNQTNLYDQTVSLTEQMTDTPIIVANAIKKHIRNFAASYGIEYSDERLDACIKRLMDMAINTGSDDWVVNARPIFMDELKMSRNMVMQAALMRDLWTYLNTIKWGGSQEIQMGIGQSITLLTPIAVVRYVGALSSNAVVWNPQIVDSIVSPEGEILSQRTATKFNTLESAKPYMAYILKGMKGVVDEGGTAKSYFNNWKYNAGEVMAGKTGTSQVTIGGIKLDLENNAWFVALTPQEDPEIAVVSFIPNGYAGARATIAARDFIEFYLDLKEKAKEEVSLPGGNALAP